MELQRLGVKVFCEDGTAVALPEFIPIFHRWIQTHAVGGLPIDVADYSHVPHGPGILLVCHEGIYGIDEGGGRRGLVYYQRQPAPGPLADRLVALAHAALAACRRLAAEPELAGRIAFRGEELSVFANDRLLAPNVPETLTALRPSLAALLSTLYPGVDCGVVPEPDPKERFAVTVTAPGPLDVETLLGRLGG